MYTRRDISSCTHASIVGLVWALVVAASSAASPAVVPWVFQARTPSATPSQLPVVSSISDTFPGFSIEWTDIDSFTLNPAFPRVLRNIFGLRSGAEIIRIGGNSQDLLNTTIPADLWLRLAALTNATGCKFVIGLNLMTFNVSLAVTQTTNAIKYLPAGSIYAFEFGNEPDRYQFIKKRAFGYITNGAWTADINAYLAELAPIWTQAFNTTKMLCGPSFSVALALNQDQLRSYLTGFKSYLKLVAAHKYIISASNGKANLNTLSLNSVVAQFAKDIDQMRANAVAQGMKFVVNEMNSFSQGGKANVSDTMAAALWGLDQCLYFASKGVSGVNFHGGNCAAYSPIGQPGQCDPSESLTLKLNPLLYSFRLLQVALSNMTTFITANAITSNNGNVSLETVSTYVLSNVTSGEAHVVIINKNTLGEKLHILVQLQGNFTRGQGTYLIGPSLAAQTGATYAGASMNATGQVLGAFQASYPASARLTMQQIQQGKILSDSTVLPGTIVSQFAVIVPPASALLLTAWQ